MDAAAETMLFDPSDPRRWLLLAVVLLAVLIELADLAERRRRVTGRPPPAPGWVRPEQRDAHPARATGRGPTRQRPVTRLPAQRRPPQQRSHPRTTPPKRQRAPGT